MSTLTNKLINTKPQSIQTPLFSPTQIQSTRPKTHLPESVTNRISDFCSDRRDLVLTGHQVCKRWQESFSKVLNLKDSDITDDELIKIIYKNRKHLTYIDLSKCKNITDKSLQYISKLKNLKYLNLSECINITDKGIKKLSHLQNLTELNLYYCKNITDAGIKDLSKLKNLINLSLQSCDKLTDAAIKDLSKLKNLENLNLARYSDICYFTEEGIKDLVKLKKLKSLSLTGCYTVTDAVVKDLAKLDKLTELHLSYCERITEAALKDLSELQTLKNLSLMQCNVTDTGIKYLSNLQKLEILSLNSSDQITDAGIKDLSKLQNLKDLSLSRCPNITDAAIRDISKLQNLTTLSLMYDNLTNAGVKHLSKLQNLTTLFLVGCTQVTEACIENLRTLHLTQFSLSGQKIKLICAKNPQAWNDLLHIINEQIELQQFINTKSTKFGIQQCELLFTGDESGMSCKATNSGFEISVNPLFLLQNKDIDAFLLHCSEHQERIKAFLIEHRPELLDEAARDLINWFNMTSIIKAYQTEDTQIRTKEILIMHALGKLDDLKHFLLVHEMGHAHDHNGAPSLGDFVPSDLDFIKSHQYGEMRADLTAAREQNAHKLGVTYFEWRSIIARPSAESDVHPTDANRAKAIKLDYDRRTPILTTT